MIRYKKHTGKPSLTHLEAMHEAICYGWIDTTLNRIDDEKYMKKAFDLLYKGTNKRILKLDQFLSFIDSIN